MWLFNRLLGHLIKTKSSHSWITYHVYRTVLQIGLKVFALKEKNHLRNMCLWNETYGLMREICHGGPCTLLIFFIIVITILHLTKDCDLWVCPTLQYSTSIFACNENVRRKISWKGKKIYSLNYEMFPAGQTIVVCVTLFCSIKEY